MRFTPILTVALATCGILSTTASRLSGQAVPDSLPAGVTAEMISQGAGLFKGAGLCTACHGPDGKGVPNLGANLSDAEWRHGNGSYEAILATIRAGVSADKSSTGSVMPPKGGSSLNDAQLKAVAAYVWSLSRKR